MEAVQLRVQHGLEIRNAMDDLQEKLCKANRVENYKENVVWLQG